MLLKDINVLDFNKSPNVIKKIWILSYMKFPISSKMMESAINEYPEYFENKKQCLECKNRIYGTK